MMEITSIRETMSLRENNRRSCGHSCDRDHVTVDVNVIVWLTLITTLPRADGYTGGELRVGSPLTSRSKLRTQIGNTLQQKLDVL